MAKSARDNLMSELSDPLSAASQEAQRIARLNAGDALRVQPAPTAPPTMPTAQPHRASGTAELAALNDKVDRLMRCRLFRFPVRTIALGILLALFMWSLLLGVIGVFIINNSNVG